MDVRMLFKLGIRTVRGSLHRLVRCVGGIAVDAAIRVNGAAFSVANAKLITLDIDDMQNYDGMWLWVTAELEIYLLSARIPFPGNARIELLVGIPTD